MISTPIPDGRRTNIDLRGGEYGTVDVHANTGNRGERVSWLVETVQSQSDGFKRIDGPVGGDTGYDIADYRSVAPEYGDLETATRLIEEAHRRGLKIVLDMVLKKKINIDAFVQTRPMSTIVETFEEAHKESPDKRIVLTPDF